MPSITSEKIAVGLTAVGILAVLLWPFSHEELLARGSEGDSAVFTLSAVSAAGVWTDEEVTGSNYWRTDFTAARPILQAGTSMVLRLKSPDVVHSFYCPGLGIGPVEVYPGHLVTVELPVDDPGVFLYYCTTVCGDPHYSMRGEIVVLEAGQSPPEPQVQVFRDHWREPPPEAGGRVERGAWLFRQRGCLNCHGVEGRGGIPNFNYTGGYVPPLNSLAEKIELFEPEEADAFVHAIEAGRKPDDITPEEFPPDGELEFALNRYHEVFQLIQQGRTASKRDLEGPNPPLNMPAWGDYLAEEDIDSIIAYLLTLQDWEEEE